MAEALGVAGSIVGLIGLAGQILQGCKYIGNLLDSIRDAPNDLRELQREAKIFEQTSRRFQELLHDVESIDDCSQLLNMDAILTMERSKDAVDEVWKLFGKYSGNGGKARWRSVKAAIAKDNIEKSVLRLYRARSDVSSLLAEITAILQLDQRVSIGLLRTEQRASAGTITDTHQSVEVIKSILFGNSKDMRLIGDTLTTMRSDLSELAVTNGNTQLMIQDFRRESEAAMSSLMFDVTKSIDKKMIMASQTVDSIIRDAIVREFNTFKSLPNHQDPSWSKGQLPGRDDIPKLHDTSNSQKVDSGFQEVRQTIWRRLFRTRIGDIRLWFISSTIGGKFSLSSITVLKVTFHSHSRFLKKGRSCELQWENSAFSSPKLTVPVFRAWNFVGEESPISKACKAGNLQEVMGLFQSRQASPFDRVWVNKSRDDKYGDYVSLLTLVAEGFWDMMMKASIFGDFCDFWAKPKVQAYLHQSLKLIKLLVRNGLNAGEVQWGFDKCHEWFPGDGNFAGSWDVILTPSVLPYAEDYVRLVIDQSTMDPFSSMRPKDWSHVLWLYKEAPYPCSIASIIFQQDKWIFEDSSPRLRYFAIWSSLFTVLASPSIYERDPEGVLIRQHFIASERYGESLPGGRNDYWGLFRTRLAYDLKPDMSHKTRCAIQNYLAIYIEAGLSPGLIWKDLFNKRFHVDYVNELDSDKEARTPAEMLEPTWTEIMGKRSNEEVADLSVHRDIFYGALKKCWTQSEIDDWERFIEEWEDQKRCASLAYQLFYLEVPDTGNESKDLPDDLAYKVIDYNAWLEYLRTYNGLVSSPPSIEDEEDNVKAVAIHSDHSDPDDVLHLQLVDDEELTEDEEYYDGSSQSRPKRISIYDFLKNGVGESTSRNPRKLIEEKEVQVKAVPIQNKQRDIYKTIAVLPVLLFTFLALFRYVALPFLISLLIK